MRKPKRVPSHYKVSPYLRSSKKPTLKKEYTIDELFIQPEDAQELIDNIATQIYSLLNISKLSEEQQDKVEEIINELIDIFVIPKEYDL